MLSNAVKDFLKLESASGILLVVAAVLAMLAENSPLKPLYDSLLSIPVAIQIGAIHIHKPLLLWINDGLMAIFFFLVGLEIKREVLEGELSNKEQILLPFAAAMGGMLCPALIYSYINWGDPVAMKGWAIPSATDIAFALGLLALLGSRVPVSIKLFLLTVAIIDDLGAIIIIALFYTDDLSVVSISVAMVCIAVLAILNRRNIIDTTPYMLVGIILWASVLKSGVHATLAGVILALFIPLRVKGVEGSPLKQLEHDLHVTVAFGILPIFAFANTGVTFAGLTFASLLHPVSLGIAAGLFFGNQLGVFGLAWLMVKCKLASLPDEMTWMRLYGVAALCGVGFTMSLFISSLAFEMGGSDVAVDDRIGILFGSMLSAILGLTILHFSLPATADAAYEET